MQLVASKLPEKVYDKSFWAASFIAANLKVADFYFKLITKQGPWTSLAGCPIISNHLLTCDWFISAEDRYTLVTFEVYNIAIPTILLSLYDKLS